MEKLTKQQQEALRKCSTVRLQANLLRAGMAEDTIEGMDRQQLTTAWAEMILAGKDEGQMEGAAAAEKVPGYDPQLERERLQWEKDKFLMEMQMREKELDELKKREEEKMKFEASMKEKWESEKLKTKTEMLEVERYRLKLQEQKENDEPARLKKYADALRGVVPKQTNDPVEVVSFFRNVESLFQDFKVPQELQAALIRPFLTDRSKALISRLDPVKALVYKEVKEAVLKEYKVSAPMYRDKFNELSKKDDQTYVMYASSLFSLINGYIESRNVKDLKGLISLLVSDRMKASLRPGILRYVLSVEAKADDGWLPPYELADVVDNFVANHSDNNMPKSGSLGLTGQFSSQPKMIQRSANVPSKSVNAFTASAGQNEASKTEGKPSRGPCWRCGGDHFRKFCDQNKSAARIENRTTFHGNQMRRVNTVSAGVVNNGGGVSTDIPSTRGYPAGDLDTATVPSTTSANVTDDVNRVYRNSVSDVIEASFHQLLDVHSDTKCAVDLSMNCH